MNTASIMKKARGQEDLVTIPRREYEAFLSFRECKEFNPTTAQKRALAKAENNFQKNKTFSYNELAEKLGFGD